MNEEKLTRNLNSVGKTVFVRYFDLFKDYANNKISKEDAIEKLVQDNISNDNGATIRCNMAKQIFEQNMECRAVGIICENWQNSRLPKDVIDQAMILLQDCP